MAENMSKPWPFFEHDAANLVIHEQACGIFYQSHSHLRNTSYGY